MKEEINEPFSLTFSFGSRWKKIQLVNHEDVFKIASIFQMMLLENNIQFKVTKNEEHEPDSSIVAH